MEWTRQIDGYCERMGPGYWAEPLNAATNAAFVIAAVILWRAAPQGICRVLSAILGAIGVGSYLFHTHATVWAGVADTAPIGVYILTYLYAANRHFWGWPVWGAALGTAAFVPYAALTVPVFQALPGFAISAGYWPVPLLILGYAAALRRRLPRVAGGLAAGAALLCASLTARSLDMPLCDAVPVGTHFVWHVLNGIVLGWLIWVLSRHLRRVEGRVAAV